ncbi:hypothetical protein TIFTF001_049672 [Ficus carica]|uniref:Myb/SANT-like domain-containing protein n=1 Tax=Ficus carica TaxID=3494 RepID=A0AA87ZYA8_FICCA|nr:hypothetical protein TIFTF001_049672 [Ficus carica]
MPWTCLAKRLVSRKASGESYVWTDAKERLFLEKLDEYLAERGGKQPPTAILELWANEFNTRFGGLGYDPRTDTVVCSDETWQTFLKDNKECTHLRYEGLRHKELYFNIFDKNHAAGASAFGSVTMEGGSSLPFEFDLSMGHSGTQPLMEDDNSPSIGARRQANMRGAHDDAGPSRSRGSAGKRKQREVTDDMTYTAMEEIANHFRARSQSTSDGANNNDMYCIVDCINIMKEMNIPQYQRTIMWHYFDAHPRLQRPFKELDDDDRRGIIASVVASQIPPPQ